MRQELREWLEELSCRAGLEGLPPRARSAALVIGAAVLAVAVWWWGRPPEAAAPVTDTRSAPLEAGAPDTAGRPSSAATLTVHVVGAVGRPGVYCLPAGARVAEAVDAAGGLTAEAEQSGVNLARPVTDGEQIVVPVKGAAGAVSASGAGGAGPPGAASSGGPVDLNTATAQQLDTLPGVGPATAAKIIADRTENGPFRTAEDLMRVPGIGAKRFESLKDLVTVR